MYRLQVAQGDRSPRKSVAEALQISESYVAKLLQQARKSGLLGHAAPGRSGEASQ
jgi:DNA-binding IscR family transcriptional regulator